MESQVINGFIPSVTKENSLKKGSKVCKMNEICPVSVSFTVPIKILSEANNSDHWAKKKARKDAIRNSIKLRWLLIGSVEIELPCVIKLTRVAPRNLDYDNLVYSLRSVTNIIAELILPGLAAGRADGDKRLKFEYLQRKVSKTYAVEVEIISCDTNIMPSMS
jgi:hypothetical protein